MRLSRNSQHFSLYTVRVTRFKEICDEAGIRYQTLLGYGNTRFSAFRGCIDRIISQFDALKIYFTQSDDSDSELYDFFSYPASKLVLIKRSGSMRLIRSCYQKDRRKWSDWICCTWYNVGIKNNHRRSSKVVDSFQVHSAKNLKWLKSCCRLRRQ